MEEITSDQNKENKPRIEIYSEDRIAEFGENDQALRTALDKLERQPDNAPIRSRTITT